MLIQTVLIASVVRTDGFAAFYRMAKSGLGDVAGLFMIGWLPALRFVPASMCCNLRFDQELSAVATSDGHASLK